MKRILGLSIFLLVAIKVIGQNQYNCVEIITNNPINFWVTGTSNIETDQTIQNAIIIRLRSKSSNCSIYARLTNTVFPSSFTMPSGFLKIDWTYDNSNKDYNLVSTPVSLDNTDKFLFSQRKMPSSSNYYDYYYDMIMSPPTYALVPGSYSFNILFTMTQP